MVLIRSKVTQNKIFKADSVNVFIIKIDFIMKNVFYCENCFYCVICSLEHIGPDQNQDPALGSGSRPTCFIQHEVKGHRVSAGFSSDAGEPDPVQVLICSSSSEDLHHPDGSDPWMFCPLLVTWQIRQNMTRQIIKSVFIQKPHDNKSDERIQNLRPEFRQFWLIFTGRWSPSPHPPAPPMI